MAMIRWLAIILIWQVLAVAAQAGEFPWKAGDAPPPVAGVRLGDGRVRLEAVLGRPSSTEKLGNEALVFTYRRRGLQVIYAPLDGVAIIFLQTRAAGDIGGVRLGDKREDILARWGKPASVRGPTAYYRAGSSWLVLLKLDENDRVKELGLGRFIENPPRGAKFYHKTD
jgi:hypothetical protein